ncbi:MAG: hypothetical protein K2Q10_12955 [Rhodospirillales bacterium]|nr:hypothetical protein [Rhodospirillales bacterium]
MRCLSLFVCFAAGLATALPAAAQDFGSLSLGRSSAPSGLRIQGDTKIEATGRNIDTSAYGQQNKAQTAVGAVTGNVDIRGRTTINSSAANVQNTAVGKSNNACAAVGAIGEGCRK